jgi:hypothetical protein
MSAERLLDMRNNHEGIMSLTISEDEAIAIINAGMTVRGVVDAGQVCQQDDSISSRSQVVEGIRSTIAGLENLGYRISPPLKVISNGENSHVRAKDGEEG